MEYNEDDYVRDADTTQIDQLIDYSQDERSEEDELAYAFQLSLSYLETEELANMKQVMEESDRVYNEMCIQQYAERIAMYSQIKAFLQKMLHFDKDNYDVYNTVFNIICDAELYGDMKNVFIISAEKYDTIIHVLRNTRLTAEQLAFICSLMKKE